MLSHFMEIFTEEYWKNVFQLIKAKPYKSALIFIGSIISFILLMIISLFIYVYSGFAGKLPSESELTDIKHEQASIVYSSDKKIIDKFFAENRTNIDKSEIPEHLIQALIATEDSRFYEHSGYDLRSYLRVIFKTIILGNESSGGGSTITQQLAKNLYGRPDKGFLKMPVAKIREFIIANRLENIYNKSDIILLYFNSVPFGEDIFGVESASERFFNKHAKDLKPEESAVLVGILKANTFYNPHLNPENSVKRRNVVLQLMANAKYISQSETDKLKKLPLLTKYENLTINAPAGYFTYQVRTKVQEILNDIEKKTGKKFDIEKDGLKIYSTLNAQMQSFARESVKEQLVKMQKQLDAQLTSNGYIKKYYRKIVKESKTFASDSVKHNMTLFDIKGIRTEKINKFDSLWFYHKMLNASVLIIEPTTGEVLVWIGGNNFRQLPYDLVLSHRQIASTFKPIVYATAIEQGMNADTYLANEEQSYPEYENWTPRNYDNSSTPDSTVAMWYALAHSMNLPTVDLFFKVGADTLLDVYNKMGFTKVDELTPSAALGTADISLYEIVRAYGVFANNGIMREPVIINYITDADGKIIYRRKPAESSLIFGEETCQKLTSILQIAINNGTGTRIRTQFGVKSDLAGKTGTAQNYSDAWFVSYTPNLVAGAWVGAYDNEVHFRNGYGSGSSLALPIIGKILRDMEKNSELRRKYLTQFNLPDYISEPLYCAPFVEKGIIGALKQWLDKIRDSDSENEE